MSARITVHCNTTWPEGTCARQLLTDARTVTEARGAAAARGWRSVDEHDYCPGCSGRGPQPAHAVVAVLHPQD